MVIYEHMVSDNPMILNSTKYPRHGNQRNQLWKQADCIHNENADCIIKIYNYKNNEGHLKRKVHYFYNLNNRWEKS